MQETLDLWPSREELVAIFDRKYRRTAVMGWLPRMRLDFGYFNPDDHYEAIVRRLVTPGAWWADIGCGRDVFPSNSDLAMELSERCAFMFGIDRIPTFGKTLLSTKASKGWSKTATPSTDLT